MTLQIFATSAEGHDGTEIRLFVGELERLGSLPGRRDAPVAEKGGVSWRETGSV